MKKAKRILLSALAVFSLFFTMTVNAEEVTPTKSLADLTQEEFNTIISDTIDVSITKTDAVDYAMTHKGVFTDDNQLKNELEEKLTALFNAQGYSIEEKIGDDTQYEQYSIMIYTSDVETEEISKATVRLNTSSMNNGTHGSGFKFTKEITIRFAKESNYSADDETYVKNKVNSMKFPNKFNANGNNYDAIFRLYEFGNPKLSSDEWWDEEYNFLLNYNYSSLINDNSITIKVVANPGTWGDGLVTVGNVKLFFYKNNVLYDEKNDIRHIIAYGFTLENGTPVAMGKISDNYNTYKEMAKELESKGLTNIIGCYELKAYGSTYKGMKVSFTVGTDYNGKEVQILHKKSDGTYETLKATVENGKVTITVDEFSPFMIALSDTVNNAPNNAQTSSINIIFYSILAISSLLGIAYLIVSKKKLEA